MHTRQRGVAIVEFALILPLLLLLTFITTEFGRAMYQYNTLTKSVRDAVRYLSMQTPNTHVAEAKNLIVYGNTGGTGTPLAIGLTLDNVPDPLWATQGTNPLINTVTVRITNYCFVPLFTTAFGVSFGTGGCPNGILFGDVNNGGIAATMRAPL